MKKHKPQALLICWALIAALLTACGGSSSSTHALQSENTMDVGFHESTNADKNITIAGDESPSEPTQTLNTKLIYTAELTAETTDFPKAMTDIEALVKQFGGFIEYSNLYGQIGSRSISYTLRIPKEHYTGFLKQTGELCTIIDKQESLDDVSEHYFDQEMRLKAQKTKRDRLLALLEKATKIEDIIQLEGAIANVQTEIDSLQGTLNKYDSLINLSTIDLSLYEVHTLSNMPQSITFLSDAKHSFTEGTYAFVHFIKGALLFLIGNWPLVILLIIVAYFTRRRVRKQTKKQNQTQKNDWSSYYCPNAPHPPESSHNEVTQQDSLSDKQSDTGSQ